MIAAFLQQRGRTDLLRYVAIGVGAAVLLCIAIGVTLDLVSRELPQRQQEGLETVVGLIAVAMVTYMVIWMRRHARDLKGELEGSAAAALAAGSATALVLMAFLAVLREGFETAVFLLAAFNETDAPVASGAGALLGIAVACALGYGIYRGGVSLDLGRFFRITGALLVLVAAGLLVSAAHTAHEAGWLDWGQQRTVDLTWLVGPGTVRSSLLTGMLGLQPQPVAVEVVVWFLYLIPVGLYVLWPPRRPVPFRALAWGGAGLALAGAVTAVVLLTTAPAAPAPAPASQEMATATTGSGVLPGGGSGSLRATRRADGWSVSLDGRPAHLATPAGAEVREGRAAEAFAATWAVATPAGLPATLSLARVIASNDGRLPLGVNARTEPDPVSLTYTAAADARIWIDRATGRMIDATQETRAMATAAFTRGPSVLAAPVGTRTAAATPEARAAAVAAAQSQAHASSRRSSMRAGALVAALVAVLALVTAAVAAILARRGSGLPPRRSTVDSRSPSHG